MINAGTTGDINLRANTAGPIGVEHTSPKNSINAPPGPASWSAKKPKIRPFFKALEAAKSSEAAPRANISTPT